MTAVRADEDGMSWYFGVPFKSKRKEAEMGRELKVGDRVLVVKTGWPESGDGSWHCADIGDVDTVIGFERADGHDRVEGKEWFYHYDEIELLPHYARGTRIKLLRDHGVYKAGHRGTVTYENDENVGALMDIGRYAAFPHEVVGLEDDIAPDCAGRKDEQGAKSKPKFKAGDVVRARVSDSADDVGFLTGNIFVLTGGDDNSVYFLDNDGDARVRPVYEFELVTAAPCPQDNEQHGDPLWRVRIDTSGYASGISLPQPAIVALINKDGKPRPSQRPHVHASVADATKEAERLARNNPGQEFAVYQRVAGRVAEVQMKEVA